MRGACLSPPANAVVFTAVCSYNRVNGTYSCENNATISILKKDFGFDGWLMSDWGESAIKDVPSPWRRTALSRLSLPGATHSAVESALAGLDQEFPNGLFFGVVLQDAVAAGKVPQSRIDDMIRRMLIPM